jgi:thymidine phosphorylase
VADAAIDHAAGIVLGVEPGDAVEAGSPLLYLHHNDAPGFDEARALAASAIVIEDRAPEVGPLVLEWVTA